MSSANCPVCGEFSGKEKAVRNSLPVFSCRICRADFTPLPDSDVIESKDTFIHGIQVGYDQQVEIARKILPERLREYENILGRKVSSVLEIGCATGAYSIPFRELGVEYVGFEIEEEMARSAKIRTGQDIRAGNFMDARLDGEFDVIFLSQVLEHVPNPLPFLQKCRELVPNGLIHIDVPNHDSLTSIIRKISHPTDYGFIQPYYHLIAYTKDTFHFMADRVGLEARVLAGFANDHRLWGQLNLNPPLVSRLIYRISETLGRGSLLTGIFVPKATN